MIPLESRDNKKPKIVIGHNVAYDRSRVREQYYRNVRNFLFDLEMMFYSVYGQTFEILYIYLFIIYIFIYLYIFIYFEDIYLNNNK